MDVNAYDPLSHEVKRHKHEVFAALRAACPVHHHRMPPAEIERQTSNWLIAAPTHEFWSVFRYDDAVGVLSDGETFSNKEGPAPERAVALTPDGMLLTADEPAHMRHRKIVLKAFIPRVVNTRIPMIRGVLDDLVDDLAPAGRMELMRDLAFPLTLAMITDVMGAGRERKADIARWVEATAAGSASDAAAAETSGIAVLEMFGYLSEVLTERRAALGRGETLRDDVLSVLMTADFEGSTFSDEEILMASHQLFTAGTDSTATAIGNGVHLLLTNPAERAKLHDDWSLLGGTVEEVLRFDPPVEATFRTTTRAVTLGTHELPTGAKVRVVYASANHDDARFSDPDTFRIDRESTDVRGHIAFAAGRHACLGAALARAELSIAFETVLRRLPGLRLDPDDPPVHSTALHSNGFSRLPLRWDPAAALPRIWT
jgi:cytochrome P450